MKWKYFPLSDDDVKAKRQVLHNMSIGALEHSLTAKLLSRFSEASGRILLIAFDNLDLHAECLYAHATYDGGKRWYEAAGTDNLQQSQCPIGGLILFVADYLGNAEDRVVLCEDFFATRRHTGEQPPRESCLVFHQDEVYHILRSKDTNAQAIEAAIRESRSPWAVGVCSTMTEGNGNNTLSEARLEIVVTNTTCIFTSALNGEGYLVWFPEKNRVTSRKQTKSPEERTGSE